MNLNANVSCLQFQKKFIGMRQLSWVIIAIICMWRYTPSQLKRELQRIWDLTINIQDLLERGWDRCLSSSPQIDSSEWWKNLSVLAFTPFEGQWHNLTKTQFDSPPTLICASSVLTRHNVLMSSCIQVEVYVLEARSFCLAQYMLYNRMGPASNAQSVEPGHRIFKSWSIENQLRCTWWYLPG